MPTFNAMSGVIGGRFALPRMPSVPKYFPAIVLLASTRGLVLARSYRIGVEK